MSKYFDIKTVDLLANPEKIKKVSTHRDPDGITAAVLLYKGLGLDPQKVKLIFPKNFGDVSDNPDIVLDQSVLDKNWKGVCIDHHPPRFSEDERAFELIWDNVPASVVTYKVFEDTLSEEDKWKVVIGAEGDQQVNTIPRYLWNDYPEISFGTGYPKKMYGKLSIFPQRMYQLAKSLLSFAMRIGDVSTAFGVLYDATCIEDIIFNDYLYKCRETVTKEMNKVINYNLRVVNYPKVLYGEYCSKMSLWIPNELDKVTYKTIIALNKEKPSASIRGPLAQEIADKLTELGFNAGGHPGFCGVSIPSGQTEKFRQAVFKILKNV